MNLQTVNADAARHTALVLGEVATLREAHRAKGYGAAHDDGEADGALIAGAIAYCITAWREMFTAPSDWYEPSSWWPWELKAWKPGPIRHMLLKATALLVAEVERLDRRAARGEDTGRVTVIRRPLPIPLDLSTTKPLRRILGVRTILVVCHSRRRAAQAVRNAGFNYRDKRRVRFVYVDTPCLLIGRPMESEVVDMTSAEDVNDAELREVLGPILPRLVSLDELAASLGEVRNR